MFWYNGQLRQTDSLELAIDEPGLLYGATVFTTLRVYHHSLDSPLTNWKSHCDRLISSLRTFGWELPNLPQVRKGAEVLSASYPILRITIFPNGREWITGRYLPADLERRQQLGITAWLADAPRYRRTFPAHKTGNYLPNWLAQQTSQQLGAQEAILLDATGNWLETSTGNLWGWKDNSWWTPLLEAGILPGVVRSQLIFWLKQNNHSLQGAVWDRKMVLSFEAIAYTNSVVEVIPIHTVLNPLGELNYDPLHPSFEQLRRRWKLLS